MSCEEYNDSNFIFGLAGGYIFELVESADDG